MSSNFDSLFASAAVPILAQTFGRTGVFYTAEGGQPIELAYAILSEETSEEIETPSGLQMRRVRTLTLVVDSGHANYSGVADPQLGASVAADGMRYALIEFTGRDESIVDVKVKHIGQTEMSRPGFRKDAQ